MDQPLELPGDATAARVAYAAAATGAAGLLSLTVMYAVEVPRGGPYVFGTINDATGAVFNVLAIPVILQVHRRVPPATWTEPVKWLTVTACAAGAASSSLLVLRVLDYNPSTVASVAAIALQGAWLFLVHRRLRGVEGYPRRLARLGRLIGGAVLVGLPVAGGGYVLPGPEWLRVAIMGAGTAVGAAAWLAWPYWYFKAAQYLDHGPNGGTARASRVQTAG